MLKFTFNHLFSLFLLFCIPGCDKDRFTGFKQEAEELAKTTHIHGEIVDTFTKTPVYGAVFQARKQQTVSDRKGLFEINLVISDDDQYNRPLEIDIFAQKFYPGTHKRIIMPIENYLRFTLDRAAPVIDTTILVEVEDLTQDTLKHYLCQAIITDYQGASTVTNVSGIFMYAVDGKPSGIVSGMNRIRNVSAVISHWQGNVSLKSIYRLLYSYKIKAIDDENYSDTLDHINWKLDDQLLFSSE